MPIIPLCAASFHKIDTSHRGKQDGVKIPLTEIEGETQQITNRDAVISGFVFPVKGFWFGWFGVSAGEGILRCGSASPRFEELVDPCTGLHEGLNMMPGEVRTRQIKTPAIWPGLFMLAGLVV